MIENGWEIIEPHCNPYEEQNLHYLCRCETVTTRLYNEDPEHQNIICQQCGNNLFLSLKAFQDERQHLFADYFNYSTHCHIDKLGWHILTSYAIPIFNPETKQVTLSVIKALESSLLIDGSIQQKVLNKHLEKKAILKGLVASNLSSLLKEKSMKELTNFVNKNISSHLTWLHNKNIYITLPLVSYLLQNTAVKELDLFFWKTHNLPEINTFTSSTNALIYLLNNKKEKSVKKALFSYYQGEISKTKKQYDPTFDYVVLRTFDDPNYLVFLLSLPTYYKNNMFYETHPDTLINAIRFLQEYYSQENIYKLIKQALKIKNTYNLWKDCFRMLSIPLSLPIFKEHFERPKPKVILLHDELVRLQNLYINANKVDMLKTFNYSKHQIRAQESVENLDFRLPTTAKELHSWGKELHNCMFSYSSSIESQQTIIYGVFKKQKLTYAVEVKSNKIVQARAVNNSRLHEDEKRIIYSWQKKLLN